MNKEDKTKFDKWAKTLTKKELKLILADCIEELIIGEMISFCCGPPMWSNSGDYLDGKQRTYGEDE